MGKALVKEASTGLLLNAADVGNGLQVMGEAWGWPGDDKMTTRYSPS